MQSNLSKRFAVLVTGCNGGIGQSLCKAFKSTGYLVIGTDVHQHQAMRCDDYIQCDLLALTANENIQQQFIDSVRTVLDRGKCEFQALINNAAYQVVRSLCELSVSEFYTTQQINVIAPFVLTRLLESQLRVTRGSIVNIGSIHARLTKPGFCAYSTSKAALSGLTRALALELDGEVTVNTILPAATKTAMLLAGFKDTPEKYAMLEAYHPVGRVAEPDEIARLALFLCSENARFITGAEIPIDGGIGGRLHDPV